ncbi:MAG: methyltransferase domain-containing protein [Candidatus Aminicenantales bacterium]|jgi:SAM-dependent methyltransferase
MAADIGSILRNLREFYDFSGKHLLAVGAGGGQFAAYGRDARTVTAVERDAAALEALREAVSGLGLDDRFAYWSGDFADCPVAADVVLFEFCLHEMDDPAAAAARALRLAPEAIILDHAPGSPWIYYGAEDDKVERSWKSLAAFPLARRADFTTGQHFADFGELEAKVRPQGQESLRRIEPFRGRTSIVIPMIYAAALLQRPGA